MLKFDQAMELKLKKSFLAPANRVFRAWSDPEVLKMWWHAWNEYECSVAEVDFKVDGLFRLGMVHTDKKIEHIAGGRFIEIISDKKIVFTWKWENSDEEDSSTVTIDFIETENGTDLILNQTGFSSEDSKSDHNKGWNLCLDELVGLLTPVER